MGKCIAYVAAAVVFMGLGALAAGACVWFLAPREKEDPPKGIQEIRYAECNFVSNTAGIEGTVYLQQASGGANSFLTIKANITGLIDGLHGFHIHNWGVPADGNCTVCGGHYNPEGFPHGAPTDLERHVGDLGNINATDFTVVEIEDSVAKLFGDKSIVGRSINIHAGQDDLGMNDSDASKSNGDAGGRLACCTIYLVDSGNEA